MLPEMATWSPRVTSTGHPWEMGSAEHFGVEAPTGGEMVPGAPLRAPLGGVLTITAGSADAALGCLALGGQCGANGAGLAPPVT